MPNNHKLTERLVAYVVLLSLFLQSCGGFSNLPVARVDKSDDATEPYYNIQPGAVWQGKEIMAAGGHLITLYEKGPGLEAQVSMNGSSAFSKQYSNLPVHVAPSISLENVLQMEQHHQTRYVDVIEPTSMHPGRVYIGKRGLLGGMMKRQESGYKDLKKVIQLRGYFYKNYLEITPVSCVKLLELMKQQESSIVNYNGPIHIKDWEGIKNSTSYIESANSLQNLLWKFSHINKFKLSCENKNGKGVGTVIENAVTRAIQFCEELIELDLSGCEMDATKINDILESIDCPGKMQLIDLRGNKVNEETILYAVSKFLNAEVRFNEDEKEAPSVSGSRIISARADRTSGRAGRIIKEEVSLPGSPRFSPRIDRGGGVFATQDQKQAKEVPDSPKILDCYKKDDGGKVRSGLKKATLGSEKESSGATSNSSLDSSLGSSTNSDTSTTSEFSDSEDGSSELSEGGLVGGKTQYIQGGFNTALPIIKKEEISYGRRLGAGAMGIVFEAMYKNNPVAVKQLKSLSEGQMLSFEKEAIIMLNHRHKNLVKFLGFCPGDYALMMEYLPGGSLWDLLKGASELSWSERSQIGLDIVEGMTYLHDCGIVHCDLKSDNVLLDRNKRAKITDFGLAAFRGGRSDYGDWKGGTLRWMAPELFCEDSKNTKAGDVYSYGMILWQLGARKLPFASITSNFQIVRHITGGNQEAITEDTPKWIKEIIEQCWLPEPPLKKETDLKNRPTMIEVRRLFERSLETDGKEKEEIDYEKVELIKRVADLEVELEKEREKGSPSPLKAPEGVVVDNSVYARYNFNTYLPNIEKGKISYGRQLGVGAMGVVYECTYRNNSVAVKKLLSSMEKQVLSFQQEAVIMFNHRHMNIISFLGFCPAENAIMMEYAAGGSLSRLLKSAEEISWKERYQIGLDIAEGMSYLHDCGIVHCDLKSDNILLDESRRAKITDFGLSALKTENNIKSIRSTKSGKVEESIYGDWQGGTLRWMAPEIFYTEKNTKAGDVYSYGMVLWQLGARKEPYETIKVSIPSYIAAGNKEVITADTPLGMKEVIEKCWLREPPLKKPTDTKTRPTMKEVRFLLERAKDREENMTVRGRELMLELEKLRQELAEIKQKDGGVKVSSKVAKEKEKEKEKELPTNHNSQSKPTKEEKEAKIRLESEVEDIITKWPGGEKVLAALKATGDTLSIAYASLNAEKMGTLVRHPHFIQVHTLDLKSNRIDDASTQALASSLSNMQVQTLFLRTNQIGDQGMHALAQALPSTRIHTLSLRTNNIGVEGVQALASVLYRTCIHTLDLRQNKLGTSGMVALASVLPETHIQDLDVAFNEIGDAGVEALAKVLSRTRIHTLDLEGSKLSTLGAESLGQILASTQVSSLSLCFNKTIGSEKRSLLKEQFPKINFKF